MTTRLPDDICHRLKQLAARRGISLNKLIEELSIAALATHDAEIRFSALVSGANTQKALDVLARLDADDRRMTL
jgi:predicted transcriptional regulator